MAKKFSVGAVYYAVHWARANQADTVVALRSGAQQHDCYEAAEAEALTMTAPRPDVVPIVSRVVRYSPI